jgi:lysophospholipase L1-like esterase
MYSRGLFLSAFVLAASSYQVWAAPPRVVCLGDSITDGHTYPLLIEQALREAGKEVPLLINAGIAGDGVAGMRRRLNRDVFHYHPDVIIVSAGINDLGMPVDKYAENIKALVGALKEQHVRVVLLTLTPLAERHKERWPKLDAFNDVLRRTAAAEKVTVGEVFQVLRQAMDKGTVVHEADGTHLNFEGYRLLTRAILDGLGHPDVAVPKMAKVSLCPGGIRQWRVRGVTTDAPLAAEAVASLKVDESWKEYRLLESEKLPAWWLDQERQRGIGVSVDRVVGPAKRYQAVATIVADKANSVYLHPGGTVDAVWLNGKQV